MIQHKCKIHTDERKKKLSCLQQIILINPDNPLRLKFFRSDVSVRLERQRHLNVSKCTIHPFSKFRAWYEMYLIFLYGSLLITKPFDTAFVKTTDLVTISPYRIYTVLTDFLTWIDIILNFVTGFDIPRKKIIELRMRNIAKHYIFGPYFITDVLSCMNKQFAVGIVSDYHRRLAGGMIALTSLLKVIRLISMVKYFRRSCEYWNIMSKGKIFLVCSIIVSLMIIHWMACMQFAVPRLLRRTFTEAKFRTDNGWFFNREDKAQSLYYQSMIVQYTHCFFRSSAYILGIRIGFYHMRLPDEYMLALFTFFIGKIIITFIWIILAVAILNTRLIEIKFVEIINQLEEYMRQKQLPLNLRNKIVQYFVFKYRNKYFKEQLISSLLSEKLKREAGLHVCKSLITNVSLFSELSPVEVSKVMDYLIPEIFLPNDTIIHAGAHGDAMYFLSSGTVAVYTRSGREICHLQDGAYFGEIALLLKGQLRTTTIVALEASQVYKLSKRNLEKCLLINRTVKSKLMKEAEDRLTQTTQLEEQYKEMLFEQSFRKIVTGTSMK